MAKRGPQMVPRATQGGQKLLLWGLFWMRFRPGGRQKDLVAHLAPIWAAPGATSASNVVQTSFSLNMRLHDRVLTSI